MQIKTLIEQLKVLPPEWELWVQDGDRLIAVGGIVWSCTPQEAVVSPGALRAYASEVKGDRVLLEE